MILDCRNVYKKPFQALSHIPQIKRIQFRNGTNCNIYIIKKRLCFFSFRKNRHDTYRYIQYDSAHSANRETSQYHATGRPLVCIRHAIAMRLAARWKTTGRQTRCNKVLIAKNQIWMNGLLYMNITERKYIKLRHKQLCETEKYGDISGHGFFNFKITEI